MEDYLVLDPISAAPPAAVLNRRDEHPHGPTSIQDGLQFLHRIATQEMVNTYYRGPLDIDNWTGETWEMRKAYRRLMLKEPAVKTALFSKIQAVANLDPQVLAEDDEKPADKAAADFVDWSITRSEGGWPKLIEKTCAPMLIDGFGVAEKLYSLAVSAKYPGFYTLKGLYSLDTQYIRFDINNYKEVTRIRNVKTQPVTFYDPPNFMVTKHMQLFESPFGISDLRAAYRAANLIETAIKLRAILLENYSGPFLAGKYRSGDQAARKEMEEVVQRARSMGWIVMPNDCEVESINLAAKADQEFQAAIEDLRKEIYTAICGTYLQFTESSKGAERGNTSVHKEIGEIFKLWLANQVCEALNSQLVPDLVIPNFGSSVGMPRIQLGGMDIEAAIKRVELFKAVSDLTGGEISKKQVYDQSRVEPPKDDADRIKPPQQPGSGGMGGMPPPGGAPPDAGGGGGMPPPDGGSPPPEPGQKFRDASFVRRFFDNSASSQLDKMNLEDAAGWPPAGELEGRKLAAILQPSIDAVANAFVTATKARLNRGLPNGGERLLWSRDERAGVVENLAALLAFADLLARARLRQHIDAPHVAKFADVIGGAELFGRSGDTPFQFISAPPRPMSSPSRAVEYITSLVPIPGVDAMTFATDYRRKAFTLAANAEVVILEAVQKAVISELQGEMEATGTINQILLKAGLSPKNPQYAEMVARTNAMDAYNTGFSDQMQTDPQVQSDFPVWQYCGILDGREGDDHRPQFDKYYPAEADFRAVRGPRVYNCRCVPRPIYKTKWASLRSKGARLSTPPAWATFRDAASLYSPLAFPHRVKTLLTVAADLHGEIPPERLRVILGHLADDHNAYARAIGYPPEASEKFHFGRYDESLHPRDDHGRWVDKADLASARVNSGKARELRARVTKPAERAKLDKVLGSSALPSNKGRGKELTGKAGRNEASPSEQRELFDHLPGVDGDELRDASKTLAQDPNQRTPEGQAAKAKLTEHVRAVAAGQTPMGGEHPVHAMMRKAIDDAPKLNDKQKARYSATMDHVLKKMPVAAHDRIAANVHSVGFHGTTAEVGPAAINDALSADYVHPKNRQTLENYREAFAKGKLKPGASFHPKTGTLHLNGDIGERYPVAQVYAHSLAHAIDGPDHEISSSPEWGRAWTADIQSKASGPQKLNRYASMNPHEGFAEFVRLAFGSQNSPDAIEHHFPIASAVMKSKGLWHGQGAQQSGPTVPTTETSGKQHEQGSKTPVSGPTVPGGAHPPITTGLPSVSSGVLSDFKAEKPGASKDPNDTRDNQALEDAFGVPDVYERSKAAEKPAATNAKGNKTNPHEMTRDEFKKNFWFHGQDEDDPHFGHKTIHGGISKDFNTTAAYSGVLYGKNGGQVRLIHHDDVHPEALKRMGTDGAGNPIIDRLGNTPSESHELTVPATNASKGDYRPIDPHRHLVEQALKNGQHVPANVLAEYPDLKSAAPAAALPSGTEHTAILPYTPNAPLNAPTPAISLPDIFGERVPLDSDPGGHHIDTLAKTHRDNGTPADPSNEHVYTVPTKSLKVDPALFQYKVSGIGAGGVSNKLSKVKKWDPNLGGVSLVWRDPKSGTDYVVNGHHRHELAERTGQDKVNVRYIDAKDAQDARAQGALANIAEGNGKAIDAAKYMRDSGRTVEDLKNAGVASNSKMVQDAVALKDLGQKPFQAVTEGRLDEDTAVAVAKHLKDPELQDALFTKIRARENAGNEWTPRQIEVAAKKLATAGKAQAAAGNDLFGDVPGEESTFDQEVDLESFANRKLAQSITDYSAVGNKDRAGRVADAGNKLNLAENANRRKQAADMAENFDKFANLKSNTSALVREHAAQLAEIGQHGSYAKKNQVRDDFYAKLPDAINADLAGKPVPRDAGAEGADQRSASAAAGASGERTADAAGGAAAGLQPAAGPSAESSGLTTPPDETPAPSMSKAEAKAMLDKLPVPEHLPEKADDYFAVDANTPYIDVSAARSTRARPDGIANAAKLMEATRKGLMPKRGPINVLDNGDGTYTVSDGNSTFNNAQKNGWQKIPVHFVTPEEHQAEIEKTAGKEMKKIGPALGTMFKPEHHDLPKTVVTPHSSAEEIFAAAQKDKPVFDSILDTGNGVDKALGGQSVHAKSEEEFNAAMNQPGPVIIVGGIKGEKRATEKVNADYEGQWGMLHDVLRGTVAVDTLQDIPKAVETLTTYMESKGWKLAKKPKDRVNSPTDQGYRDILLNFQSPDGLITEVQVNTKPMIKAKGMPGHELYEQARKIEADAKTAGRPMTPEEQQRYDDLAEKAKKLYQTAHHVSLGATHAGDLDKHRNELAEVLRSGRPTGEAAAAGSGGGATDAAGAVGDVRGPVPAVDGSAADQPRASDGTDAGIPAGGASQGVDALSDEPAATPAAEPAKPAANKSKMQKLLDAGDAAKARLKKKFNGRLLSGVDPTDLKDIAVLLAAKIAGGGYSFAKWAKRAVKAFGAGITPHIQSLWDTASETHSKYDLFANNDQHEEPDLNAVEVPTAKPGNKYDLGDGSKQVGDTDWHKGPNGELTHVTKVNLPKAGEPAEPAEDHLAQISAIPEGESATVNGFTVNHGSNGIYSVRGPDGKTRVDVADGIAKIIGAQPAEKPSVEEPRGEGSGAANPQSGQAAAEGSQAQGAAEQASSGAGAAAIAGDAHPRFSDEQLVKARKTSDTLARGGQVSSEDFDAYSEVRDAGQLQEKPEDATTKAGKKAVWLHAGKSEKEAERLSRLADHHQSEADQIKFMKARAEWQKAGSPEAGDIVKAKADAESPLVIKTLDGKTLPGPKGMPTSIDYNDENLKYKVSAIPSGMTHDIGDFKVQNKSGSYWVRTKDGETLDVVDTPAKAAAAMAKANGESNAAPPKTQVATGAQPGATAAGATAPAAQPEGQAGPASPADSGHQTGKAGVNPHIDLAERLAEHLKNGPVSAKELFEHADAAHGGTRAQGKYGQSEAYDSLETAMNMNLAGKSNPSANLEDAKAQAEEIAKQVKNLPTQTNRTGNKDELQQFSTPPHYAFAAAWLANLKPGDTVLEPSAGTGSIAVHAANAGANVVANELDPHRVDLLKHQFGPDNVHMENAEQIGGILPQRGVSPSVVLMNPPFSTTGGRMDKKDSMAAAKHIDEALSMLPEGGRLVAIVGRGMAPDRPTYREWFRKLKEKFGLKANVGVTGKEYTKYGTSFDTRMLVIDKDGAHKGETVTGDVDTIPELMDKLEGVRNARPSDSGTQQAAGVDGGKADVGSGAGTGKPAGALPEPTADGLAGEAARGGGAGDSGSRGSASGNKPGSTRGDADAELRGNVPGTQPIDQPAQESAGDSAVSARDLPPDAGRRDVPRSRSSAGRASAEQSGGSVSERGTAAPIAIRVASPEERTKTQDVQNAANKAKGEESADSLFETYRPAKLRIDGAQKHPAALVESAAMASVEPPDPTYSPKFHKDVIDKGMLSEAALESVVYAGQNHNSYLETSVPGEVPARRGYFIGDGTGAGKGRQVAGIITDNKNQGRDKHVWVSLKSPLIEDARRDWRDLGNDEADIHDFDKLRSAAPPENGVAFITYDTLKGKPRSSQTAQKNLDRLVEWLGGEKFDGVIAFDESHAMANAIATKSLRGDKDASQRALSGIELQKKLPNARVVYVSATGATEVSNLAYADRLGLWGKGTAFPDKQAFIGEMEKGGVAAMEAVAQSMKAQGMYGARSLSMDDGTPTGKVTYDRLTHSLTPDQRQIYDASAEAWQEVLKNIDEAIESTGGDSRAKSAAYSQFWGQQQRFFNQVMTSMQTESVIKDMEQQIKEGKSPVIQLVNTMEAATDRAIDKKQEGQEYGDLDVSPREMLMRYLEKSFPTQRYEDTQDADGNIVRTPVMDSHGNPVHDPAAVAMRDAMMDKVGSLRIPESPIDRIINHFGHENVAECTGRTQRLIEATGPDGIRAKRLDRRPGSANITEAQHFQDGKKNILVFSDAGGTGRSYHSDKNAKNQNQRIHYMLQPGWRADNAVQGLGRTHRTNQANAPIFRLVEIAELKAQRRFVSTIARRLDQLGAITRGQRQAGSSGLFKATDNLESKEAKKALGRFFVDLAHGSMASQGMHFAETMQSLGFKPDKDGDYHPEKVTIPQFLNRLLSLKVDQQNAVFDQFEHRLTKTVEEAIAGGTLDTGVENFKADSIHKVSDVVVNKDQRTGAVAKLLTVKARKRLEKTPFRELTSYFEKPAAYVQSGKTGSTYAVYETADRTDPETGVITKMYRLKNPTNGAGRLVERNQIDQARYKGGTNWSHMKEDDARTAWDKEYNEAPTHEDTEEHFVTGASPAFTRRFTSSNSRTARTRLDVICKAMNTTKCSPGQWASMPAARKSASRTMRKKRTVSSHADRIAQNWRTDGSSFRFAFRVRSASNSPDQTSRTITISPPMA